MSFIYLARGMDVDCSILDEIAGRISEAFGFGVKRLAEFEEPQSSFDPKRGQYNSMILLSRLSYLVPVDAVRVLGITKKDIFIPVLSFVFGQAQLNGKIAIVSLARLRQEFYGLDAADALFLERSSKESLHELGHTFGLIHCVDQTCVMSLSTTISQVDIKSSKFCACCSEILYGKIDKIRREQSEEELQGGLT